MLRSTVLFYFNAINIIIKYIRYIYAQSVSKAKCFVGFYIYNNILILLYNQVSQINVTRLKYTNQL